MMMMMNGTDALSISNEPTGQWPDPLVLDDLGGEKRQRVIGQSEKTLFTIVVRMYL